MLGSTLIEFFTDSPHLMEEFAKRQLASRAIIPRWKDGWLRRALDFAEKPIKANENCSQRVVCSSEILLKGRGITTKKIRCCVAINAREGIS